MARFGVGYDTVDLPACSRAGIVVTIAPDGVRRPVAYGTLQDVVRVASHPDVDGLARAATGRWA